MKLYTFFNFTSIAATEKRQLSYKTPQSFHRPRYCGGVQTFPLKMHYGGEKLGKEWSDFDPQRKGSYLWGFGLWCKVSSKLSENCDRKRGDRQKDRHTDGSDFIICPMLCYSNGTDKNPNKDKRWVRCLTTCEYKINCDYFMKLVEPQNSTWAMLVA